MHKLFLLLIFLTAPLAFAGETLDLVGPYEVASDARGYVRLFFEREEGERYRPVVQVEYYPLWGFELVKENFRTHLSAKGEDYLLIRRGSELWAVGAQEFLIAERQGWPWKRWELRPGVHIQFQQHLKKRTLTVRGQMVIDQQTHRPSR